MKENNVVGLLKELNLTEYEAKALVTLFKFSECDAPTISRNSEIPKTRIYDVLEKLKERGLVLEVYKKPKTYKVINPDEIFNNLLLVKSKEFKELAGKVDELVAGKHWSEKANGPTEKILQVNNIKDYNKFLAQEFQSAQKEVHGFTHMDERVDAFKGLMANKNISVKFLTKPMTRVHDLPKHFNVQEVNHSMDAFVLDRKKVIMALTDLTNPRKSYHLTVLENNPSLAAALLSHFDDYWKK